MTAYDAVVIGAGHNGLTTAAYLTRVWIAAGLAGALSRAARWALPALPPLVVGALVLPLFGVLFLGISRAAGVPFAGRSESL